MADAPEIDWSPPGAETKRWHRAALDELIAFARSHATAQLVNLDRGRCVLNESFGCAPSAAEDVFAAQKGLFRVLLARAFDDERSPRESSASRARASTRR